MRVRWGVLTSLIAGPEGHSIWVASVGGPVAHLSNNLAENTKTGAKAVKYVA
jgi:hypothetical protein